MWLSQNLLMHSAGGGDLSPYSVYTVGTDGGLEIPSVADSDFGTGDFTYEAWIYPEVSSANYSAIVGHEWSAGGGLFYLRAANSLSYYEGSVWLNVGSAPDNEWTHVAVVRQSGTLTIYVDGASVGSTAYTRTVSDVNLYVGQNQNGAEEFQGYIYRPHVLNSAKYTTNFTPQIGYLPEATTLMLIESLDGSTFVDTQGNAVTNNGAVAVDFAPT